MIKINMKVEEKGQSLSDLVNKAFLGYKNAYVTIGVHEGAGSYTKGPNPPTVVQVALWNEFGTEKTPQRSVFRTTMEENEAKIEAMRDKLVEEVIFGKMKADKAIEALGLFVQTLIQNKIKSNVPPPYGTGKGNSSERIAGLQAAKKQRVGHVNTLRESELYLRSITFKVHLE